MKPHLFRHDPTKPAPETELATRLITCPACGATPGVGCTSDHAGDQRLTVRISSATTYDVFHEPHAGRVELLRALGHYVNELHGLIKNPPEVIETFHPVETQGTVLLYIPETRRVVEYEQLGPDLHLKSPPPPPTPRDDMTERIEWAGAHYHFTEAQFGSNCGCCGYWIKKGDRIALHGKKKPYEVRCTNCAYAAVDRSRADWEERKLASDR